MNYKNHLAFGVLAGVTTPIVIYKSGFDLNHIEMLIIAVTVLAGSLFPDTDCSSIPSRIYAIIGLFTSACFYILGMINFIFILWLPFIFAKMSKHRGWCHSWALPIFITTIPYIIYMISYRSENFRHLAKLMYNYRFIFPSFSIGLATHLLLDTKWFKKFAIKIGIHKR